MKNVRYQQAISGPAEFLGHSIRCRGWVLVWVVLGLTAVRLDASDQDPSVAPIARPENGVRLYGTASPFGSWTHCDLSPDGKWLVGFRGTRMLVWDRQAARVVKEFDVVSTGSVQSCKFSPAGKYFAVFVKHWLELPELSDAPESGDGAIDIAPEQLLQIKPKFSSQILVFDRQWKPVAEFDVDCDGPQFPDGLLFSPDESALLVNGQTVFFTSWMGILDLEDHSLHVPSVEMQRVGNAVWLNSQEIAWPTVRRTWDWRKDQFREFPKDFLPQVYSVQTSSSDGDWWLLQNQVGKVLYQRSTKREIPLTGWRGYAFGQVSPDQRYFLGVGAPHAIREVLLLDLNLETEVARVEDWGITAIRFVPDDPLAHLTMFASNAGTRARSVTLTAVPLGKGFADGLKRAQQQLPVTDKVVFAAQDEWLVLAGGRSWVKLVDGQLAGLGPSARQVVMVAAQPSTDQIYTFGTPADRDNTWDEMALTRQSRQPNSGQRLTTIQPPTEILRSLRALLGTQPSNVDGDWSVYPAHLSVSLDQTQLRAVHWEDKTLGPDSKVSRMHLNRWEVGRHKKIRSTLLAVSADQPDTARQFQLSPDGSQYAVAHNMRLWLGDAEQGQLGRDIRLPGIATGLEFSADNRWLAVGMVRAPWETGWMWPSARNQSLATEIALIEVETGLIRWQKKNLDLVGFGFLPGTNQLYNLDRDQRKSSKRFVLYRTDTWEPEFEHTTPYSEALASAFSSDGRLLAIPLADTRVEVWDLEELRR
jgi:hypothetical protein